MFQIKTTNDGHVPFLGYMTCGDITPLVGMALKLSGGVLVTASGTDKPEYISMLEAQDSMQGNNIAVISADSDVYFSVSSEDDLSTVKVGDALQISDDGMGITAEAGGRATVSEIDLDGGCVTVRFN